MIDRDAAHRIASRELGEDALVGLGEAEELAEGWFFPFFCIDEPVAGSQGLIVNKQSGEVFHLGSAFPVERDLKLYDQGFQSDVYDLVILAVHDLDETLRILGELRIGGDVIPEYEHGRVWRMPRFLTRTELQARLESLPCVFGDQGFYFRLEYLVELRESGCCEFKALSRTSGRTPSERDGLVEGEADSTDAVLQLECWWRFEIDARSAHKAERVLAWVFERLPVTARGLRMERHPDQHYNAYFVTRHEGTWQELVVEVIELAQHVGYGPWSMSLGEASLDLWAGKTNVPGCAAMHVLLPPPQSDDDTPQEGETEPFVPPGEPPGEV